MSFYQSVLSLLRKFKQIADCFFEQFIFDLHFVYEIPNYFVFPASNFYDFFCIFFMVFER